METSILVVSSDSEALAAVLDVLNTAGYQTNGASTFSEGKRLLSETNPDVLIADERLEAFNGMHLVLRGRYLDASLDAIVVTERDDRWLEAEARRLNVPCVVKPNDPREWLRVISETIGSAETPTAA